MSVRVLRHRSLIAFALMGGCGSEKSDTHDASVVLDAKIDGDSGLERDGSRADGSVRDAEPTTWSDVSAIVEAVRAEHGLIALGGAIVDSHGLRALGVAGRRRMESEERVELHDLWHLGSDTKAMTATLAAIEVERGAVAWDTTLGDAYPDWAADIDEGLRTVTLTHLLNHRAGFSGNLPGERPELWEQLWLNEGPLRDQRLAFARSYLSSPPSTTPGTSFAYANEGYILAGALLERSPPGWEERMRSDLFEPFGMTTCGFGAPGSTEQVDQPRGHTGMPLRSVSGIQADNPPALGPAGTVHCSLADWGKFVSLHLRGEREDSPLLPRTSFRHLHTPPWPEDGYAYGWGVVDHSSGAGTVYTHTGSNTLWYAVVWMAPGLDRGFLATTNVANEDAALGTDALIEALLAADPQ